MTVIGLRSIRVPPAQWCRRRRSFQTLYKPLYREDFHNNDTITIAITRNTASYRFGNFSYQEINKFQSLCNNGHLQEAINLLFQTPSAPPPHMYLAFLKACNIKKSLLVILLTYTHITCNGSQLKGFLGCYLVITLAKCGAIEDAYCASQKLHCRTVFSWSAIISACADNGRLYDALRMHELMLEDNVEPNHVTYASLFKACGGLRDLETGKRLHECARKKGFTSVDYVGSSLVSMYGKCGAFADAEDVFINLPERGVVVWNAMLSAYVEHGRGERALQLYWTMQKNGVNPDQLTLTCTLQGCGILGDKEGGQPTKAACLEIVQALHADACKKGLINNIFIGTTLVSTYGKLGTLVEAEHMYTSMSNHNRVSCNAMLSSYIEQGIGETALQFFKWMQEEGIDPDQHSFATALKACVILACSKGACLEIGQAIYDDAKRRGFGSDAYIGTALLTVFGKCGATMEAERVFGSLSSQNVVSWTAMLSAYLAGGQVIRALQLYKRMQDEGLSPDEQAFVIVLQACGMLGQSEEATDLLGGNSSIKLISLELGRGLHVDAKRSGFASGAFVGSALVSMYGKSGKIDEAAHVFCRLSKFNVVSWTAMLGAYVEQGQGEEALLLYGYMQAEGVSPDEQTILMAIQACGDLAEREGDGQPNHQAIALEVVRGLHEDAWRKGHASDVFISTTLLTVYGKCGALAEAERVFGAALERNVVSCSAMASTCVGQGEGERALELYRHMIEELCFDHTVFAIAIRACCNLTKVLSLEERSTECIALEIGRALHADARTKGFSTHTEVGKALISLYGKLGTTMEAGAVFQALFPHHDATVWNSMLSAYVEQGQAIQALQFYRYMQEEGVEPDQSSLVMALQACGALGERDASPTTNEGMTYRAVSLEIVQALHGDARRMGLALNSLAGNTILNVYGKCGTIVEAEEVFHSLPHCGVSSWNAMLTTYIKQGEEEKALKLYGKMQYEGVTADEVTSICVLQACGMSGNLTLCQELHFAIVGAGHDTNLPVAATLIHACGCCAGAVDGLAVLYALSSPHLASWSACIAGYAAEGSAEACLLLLDEMWQARMKVDGRIFTSVLTACSHAGRVVEGVGLFTSLNGDCGVALSMMHYGNMIDLLGRTGDFKRVENLLEMMPVEADGSMWSSLLGACRAHGNLQLGERVFSNAVQLQPEECSAYVVMSNIFVHGFLGDD